MFAAYHDALGAGLWFGEISMAGHLLHPLVLMFGISGSLMISRIRIPKL
jgi:CDP-diacylglycerol--serine O-phosphatidyltransferase